MKAITSQNKHQLSGDIVNNANYPSKSDAEVVDTEEQAPGSAGGKGVLPPWEQE